MEAQTETVEQEIVMNAGGDPLAKFRELVAAEKDNKPAGISGKAAERLRQINYEDRVAKQDAEKFAYALTQVSPTQENLTKLVSRCSREERHSERRVTKLLFWIQGRSWRLGHEIKSPSDIAFLSELTADEIGMSATEFAATWKVKKVVAPLSGEPEPRYCALGKECLRAFKRRGAVVPGGGEYCSVNCRGRARIRAKKETTAPRAA